MKSYGTDKISRLLRILTLLAGGRSWSADELAAELEVSRRTVFRDLNALEAAHVPYYFDDESGGYRLTDSFFLPAINFDLPEALAVMLLTGGGRGGPVLPGLELSRMAAVKIESVLPPAVREHVGGVLDHIHVGRGASAAHAGSGRLLLELAGAIRARQAVRAVYDSVYDAARLELELHPLRLIFVNRAWYLLAFSPRHDQVRTFKLARFARLDVLSDRCFTPPEVDVAKHFGQAWSMLPEGRCYRVHLRFDKAVAARVAEVRWHASQEIYWRSDGALDFHVRVDGLREICSWILGYGDLVRVIKPAALADRVARTAARVAKLYAGAAAVADDVEDDETETPAAEAAAVAPRGKADKKAAAKPVAPRRRAGARRGDSA